MTENRILGPNAQMPKYGNFGPDPQKLKNFKISFFSFKAPGGYASNKPSTTIIMMIIHQDIEFIPIFGILGTVWRVSREVKILNVKSEGNRK